MTEELIKSLGHEIVSAETGIEALAALSAKRFDVVLMAGRMHEMDGIKANRRFRDGEAGDPVMPIVALTAYALEGDPERFLEEGMDDYLSKPVGLSELCEVLEHMKRGN